MLVKKKKKRKRKFPKESKKNGMKSSGGKFRKRAKRGGITKPTGKGKRVKKKGAGKKWAFRAQTRRTFQREKRATGNTGGGTTSQREG